MEARQNPLVCARAVYGKADGQSGYRWLELTEEHFSWIERDKLVKLLSLGQENLAERDYYSWRQFGQRYCAVHSYLSLARDDAGRSDNLERTILVCDGSASLAPRMALSMFRLLESSGGADGARWWKMRQNREWDNRNFHLPGDECALDPAPQSAIDAIVGSLQRDSNEWPQRLRSVLERVVANEGPAVVELFSGARFHQYQLVVALLELLRTAGIDRDVSIAGWFPCTVGSVSSLHHWDIIVAEKGRITGASNSGARINGRVEDALHNFFGPRARPEFKAALELYSNPEVMVNIARLKAQFPTLQAGEVELLQGLIDRLLEAESHPPEYLRSLDARTASGEYGLVRARTLRLRDQLDRLRDYVERQKGVASTAPDAATAGNGVDDQRNAMPEVDNDTIA